MERRVAQVLLAVSLIGLWASSTPAYAQQRISGKEMASKAEQMVREMRTAREGAEEALRKARSDKDATRIDCVNEALIAMKGLLRLAEDYQFELQADLKQGDNAAVQSSFVKIQMARTKFEELDARVKSCGGKIEGGVVDGKPIINRTEDPDLPNLDPLDGLENQSIFVDRPPVASPYH